jgi:hypothetical protein
VINFASIGTFFSCTNVDNDSVMLGVELFGRGGGAALNDALASSIMVAAGGTVMLATSTANGFAIDRNLAAGAITKGSARILATSKKLVCTAFVADVVGSPAGSMSYVTIIAKTKQKATN